MPAPLTQTRTAARNILIAGLALATVPAFSHIDRQGFPLPQILLAFVWNSTPFFVWYGISRLLKNRVTVITSGGLLLLFCLLNTFALYLLPWTGGPTSQTLSSAFFPLAATLIFLPASLMAGILARLAAERWFIHLPAEIQAKAARAFIVLAPLTLAATLCLMNPKLRIGSPRIVAGETLLRKTPLPKLGWLFDDPLSPSGNTILELNYAEGLNVLDSSDLKKLDTFPVKEKLYRVTGFGGGMKPVRLKTDGVFFYANSNDNTLYNSAGEKIWAVTSGAFNQFAAADLDNDGFTEFYASNARQLRRLDSKGKEVWRKQNFAEQLFTVPPANGQQGLLITAKATGPGYEYTQWSPDGQLVRKFIIGGYYAADTLEWNGQHCLFCHTENQFALFDLYGKQVFGGKVSGPFACGTAKAVRLSRKEKPYLAVKGGTSPSVDRQELNLFTASGRLAYREILKGSSPLYALHNYKTRTDYLIFNGTKYSMD